MGSLRFVAVPPGTSVQGRISNAAKGLYLVANPLVIGSWEGVTETIQQLHVLRYAEVVAWSPILPVPNSSEVMSILTKYRVE